MGKGEDTGYSILYITYTVFLTFQNEFHFSSNIYLVCKCF